MTSADEFFGPERNQRGLLPFSEEKHARFKFASDYGFTFPEPHYPIDASNGVENFGMGGNGPDSTLTVNGGKPCGDCGPNASPKNANLTTGGTQMTSNAIVGLYFTYQAELAGLAWRAPATDDWTPPEGLDLGVDLGDFLLWCFKNGYNHGFVKIDLKHIDAALATKGLAIVTGVILNRLADEQVEQGKPWNVGFGDEPDPEDGHAILYLKALAKNGERVWASWGQQVVSTHKWFLKCPQQAFGVITDPDTMDPTAYNALVADLKALNGTTESVAA